MMRESSRAGSGAGGYVSGAVTAALIRYVRMLAGQTGVEILVAGARDPRKVRVLEDPTSWSSLDQTVALFDSAARILRDPEIAHHLGQRMLEQYRGTAIQGLLESTRSVVSLFRSAVTSFDRLSPLVSRELLEISDHHAVIRARTRAGVERHIYMCDIERGFLSEIPTFAGYGRATVRQTECQARGGQLCQYVLDWPTVARVEHASTDPAAVTSQPATERHDDVQPVIESHPAEPDPEQAGDPGPEILVAKLKERLDESYSTASELLVSDGISGLLGRIATRAARAVNAPRHLLVVRSSEDPEAEIHSHGFRDDERAEIASRLMALHEHSFGSDALVVDVQSPRHHYGRLAAFSPSNGFTDDDRQVLSSYASYAAAALDRLTALGQAQRSNESSNALIGFSRALAGVATVDEVAQRLAETVPLVAGCDRSTVMLLDPDEQAITVRAATGPGAEAEAARSEDAEIQRAGYRIERDSTPLFDWVLASHELVVVGLDTEDELVRSILEGTGTACAVIAPLATSDEFFGIVTANFDTMPVRDPRSDSELQTRMVGLADHAVTAMQNTQLLEQVTHLAWHDSLTALPNRRLLEDRVNQDLERARRNGESTCMFFVDLDRLKQVNDTLGHAAGDELIRNVAARLVDTVRRQDTVARLGGDEFAVLLPGLADLGDIDTLARRTLEALRRPYTLAGHQVNVSGSIGIAVAPGHGETYDELISNADAAMYRAKALGRDTYQMYSEPEGGGRPDIQLEVDLKHAVERSEMSVLYQPVVDMTTSEVVAVEAFARWQHPVRGVLEPELFLPLATDPEVIAGLDSWVVSEACRQIAAWAQGGLEGLRVSVNVASRSLAFEGFTPSVETALKSWGIDPGLIELEISDLGSLEADGPAKRAVEVLSAIGVRFAVDDVKTVSLAVSRIGSVPVSTLKLDRSFVHLAGEDADTASLVAAIVALCLRHGFTCVAEGVETESQVRSLVSLRCQFAQGNLFSPPLLASDIEQMLAVAPPEVVAAEPPEASTDAPRLATP